MERLLLNVEESLSNSSVRNSTFLSTLDIVYLSSSLFVSVISICGSCLIILTYLLNFDLRGKSREVVVHLSVGDLLSSFGVIFGIVWFFIHNGGSNADQLCRVSSSLWIFASVATFQWTLVFAVYLYIVIIWRDNALAERVVLITRILVWLIAVSVMIAAIAADVLGWSNAQNDRVSWCWIRDDVKNHLLWCYITGKGWEFFATGLIIVLYLCILVHVTREMNREPFLSRAIIHQTIIAECKMFLIPLLFVLCRIFGNIRFYIDIDYPALTKDPSVFMAILIVMQGIGDSAQGAVNCLLYCFLTPRVRRKLPCIKNTDNTEEAPLINTP